MHHEPTRLERALTIKLHLIALNQGTSLVRLCLALESAEHLMNEIIWEESQGQQRKEGLP